MFDVVWSGRRHIMMGASQIDRFGNQNFAFIGSPEQPKTQLLGFRGAPGNTINNNTSYWIPSHSTRVFVPEVDVVSGVGLRPRRRARRRRGRFHRITGVGQQPRRVRLRRRPTTACACAPCIPGVTVDEVVAATGFELVDPRGRSGARACRPTKSSAGSARSSTRLGLGEKEVPNP